MLEVSVKKRFATNGRVSFTLDVSFAVGAGITVLFGPSGSGKTTTLGAIAGVVAPDEGWITLDGRLYFDSVTRVNLPIQKRKVGFVFQDYLLFPHLTAAENVAYGICGRAEGTRRARASELLALVGVTHAADRRPRELSGGEQQRVALARALASEPDVLLLDEPLSAVDAGTRARLLEEIIEVQRRSKIPFLYVTHSPADAVRAGDNVIVLEAGKIVQQGEPIKVFNAPESAAAARAVGGENVLVGQVISSEPAEGVATVEAGGCRIVMPAAGLATGDRITLGIRSDDIIVSRERITRTSARNLLAGKVKSIIRDDGKVGLIVSCGVDLKVRVTAQAVEALDLSPGVGVYLLIKANACHLL